MKRTTKPFILTLLLVFISFNSFSQSWIWAKQGLNRDTASWSYGWAIATDSSNNVFETGMYHGGTNFGPYLVTFQPSRWENIFLVKYDSNGNVLWADSANSTAKTSLPYRYNLAYSMCSDKRGNAYLTGQYQDTINFGTDTLKTQLKAGDFFLTRYDPNGNVVWAKDAHLFSQSDYAYGEGATVDGKNNIVAVGGCGTNVAFGNDTVYTGGGGFFIAKYDTNGNIIRVIQSIGYGTSSSYATVVATDDSDNVYAAGRCIYGLTVGTYHLVTSAYGIFIVKYDSGGNLKWATAPQTTGFSSQVNSIITDNSGNVYLTGEFGDSITFGTFKLKAQYTNIYNENMFLVKYSPSGGLIWAKCATTPAGSWASGSSVAVDKHKHLYVSGGFLDTVQFGPILLKASTSSTYIMEFDTAGNPLFGTVVNTSNGPNNEISLSPSGSSLYLGGVVGYGYTYHRECIFGTDTLKSPGVQFAYLAKWGIPDTNIVTSINPINPKEQVSLFPNPNNGQFNLSISNEELGMKNIVEIYNAIGEKVYSRQFNTQNSEFKIDLGGQPAGIYLYRVLSEIGDLVGSGKFVIE